MQKDSRQTHNVYPHGLSALQSIAFLRSSMCWCGKTDVHTVHSHQVKNSHSHCCCGRIHVQPFQYSMDLLHWLISWLSVAWESNCVGWEQWWWSGGVPKRSASFSLALMGGVVWVLIGWLGLRSALWSPRPLQAGQLSMLVGPYALYSASFM